MHSNTTMKTILFKNTSISFTDQGKGTAIVLLHGFLENKKMWDRFIPELTKRHRVITIDLLGHGQTDCLGYVHTMEDQADMVYEVIHSLKIKKSILVGHSMGGYIALAYAELYPDQTKGIILINSTARADSTDRQLNRDRAIMAVKQNHANFIRIAINNLFQENKRVQFEQTISRIREEALETPLQGIIAALEGMKIRKDREVLLHFAPYPILLILGKEDSVLPYQETVNQIKDTDVKLITLDAGHMTHVEVPDKVVAAIRDFIKTSI